MSQEFWISESSKMACYGLVFWLGGLLVLYKGVKVNYTRKINFLILFLAPLLFARSFPSKPTVAEDFWRAVFFAAFLLLFIEPVRNRIPLVRTMFLSYDRPEDQPHTLLWLSTQIIAGYAVMIPMTKVFAGQGMAELMFIPILVHGIGDGLAEPVGVRFGRHKYATRALFSDKRYTRSYEGSACVFVAGLLAVLLFRNSFTPMQLAAALMVVPVVMTLAEAWSPHTWDTPLMFLSGTVALLLIKKGLSPVLELLS
jgi:dolichol kinase